MRLSVLAVLVILLAEHGYHAITWGPLDPQVTARWEYYDLRNPEIMVLCAAAARYFETCSGRERTVGLYACFLAFAEAVFTEIGGLVRFGEDISTRGWGGRLYEVCGSFPVELIAAGALAGMLTGWLNKKDANHERTQ